MSLDEEGAVGELNEEEKFGERDLLDDMLESGDAVKLLFREEGKLEGEDEGLVSKHLVAAVGNSADPKTGLSVHPVSSRLSESRVFLSGGVRGIGREGDELTVLT